MVFQVESGTMASSLLPSSVLLDALLALALELVLLYRDWSTHRWTDKKENACKDSDALNRLEAGWCNPDGSVVDVIVADAMAERCDSQSTMNCQWAQELQVSMAVSSEF